MPLVPPAAAASCGFVYVATGAAYCDEARAAAARLRESNPGARICLVADVARGPAFWDDLILVEKPALGFRDKLEMRRCPYDRFVFLDTDTLVCGDLGELFELLGRFDMIGHQLFEGHDYRWPGVPDAFPEFNTGVLGFRRGPQTTAFFAAWERNYDTFRALNRAGHYDYSNVSDQKSFRVALYQSEMTHSVIGPEFNFVVQQVNFACTPVRILHGRPFEELQRVAGRINAVARNRAWIPDLDEFVTVAMDGRRLGRLAVKLMLQIVRAGGRALLPRRLLDWARRRAALQRIFLPTERQGPGAVGTGKWERTE